MTFLKVMSELRPFLDHIPACIDPPPVPGPGMTMSNFTWNGIGALLNYTCDSGMMIPTNEVKDGLIWLLYKGCG